MKQDEASPDNRKRKARDIDDDDDNAEDKQGQEIVDHDKETKEEEEFSSKRAKTDASDSITETKKPNEGDKESTADDKVKETGDSPKDKVEDDTAAAVSKKTDNEETKSETTKSSIFGSTTGFAGFAAVKSNSGGGFGSDTGKSAFGSGGGFGTLASGFGGFSAGTSSAFGTGFGSASSSSIGGTTATNKKGFGDLPASSGSAFGASTTTTSKKSDEDADETTAPDTAAEAAPPTTTTRPIVELPTNYVPSNGEEEETVLFLGRCRTHRSPPATGDGTTESSSAAPPKAKAAPAVPHTHSLVGNINNDAAATTTAASGDTHWQEVGTGPLKVLQHVTTRKLRLVQRREVSPSGPATKVILNNPFHQGGLTKIHQPTEKHVQWTTMVDGKIVNFLFRFKLPQEATDLVKVMSGLQKVEAQESKDNTKE